MLLALNCPNFGCGSLTRVLKERARCYFGILDEAEIYTLPRQMVIHLMITVNFYMNAFVWRKGVSQKLHPMTIVKGLVPDFINKHFYVLFGEYCNTYEGTTNTMELRTVGALALGPSGNTQGGVRCYSLRIGKILSRMMKDIILAKMPEEALDDDDVENTTGVIDGENNSNNIIVDHVNHQSIFCTLDVTKQSMEQ